MFRSAFGPLLVALLGLPIFAGGLSHGPRELGSLILESLEVKDGKVRIRVDSGGCTDKAFIKAAVQKEPGVPDRVPHYVLTFERVRVDDCKGLPFADTLLEYDLAGELGMTGRYTLTVTNQVFPRSQDSIAQENALKRDLLTAMRNALAMEIRGYEARLKAAQSGTGAADNVEMFKQRLAELNAQQDTFQKMEPFAFPLGAPQEEASAVSLGQGGYGPLTPVHPITVTANVQRPCGDGVILDVEGMTRSGPFYHLAGISDGDYSRLQPGHTYQLTLYPLYKRQYAAFIPDEYVYVAEVK